MASRLRVVYSNRLDSGQVFAVRHLKPTNKSWRVDETYVRVKGRWCYLYRAIDSGGATIDFLLSAFRDADAAKRLFRKALSHPSHPQPRVINTDRAPIYGSAIPDIKQGRNPSPPLSAPTGAVLEQYPGAGSPRDQTARERQAGVPRIPGGTANDSGLRSHAHDPEGAGSLGKRERRSASSSVHQQGNPGFKAHSWPVLARCRLCRLRVQILRAHLETSGPLAAGWLRALADKRICSDCAPHARRPRPQWERRTREYPWSDHR